MLSGLPFRKITHAACNLSAVLVCLSVSPHTLLHCDCRNRGPSPSRWSEQNRTLEGVHGEMKGSDENGRVHRTQIVSRRTPWATEIFQAKGLIQGHIRASGNTLALQGSQKYDIRCEEPSKNSLASATFRHSFFLLHINYPDTVPKKKGWPGWGGGQTHEGLNRCCCLLTKANSSVTRPQT